MYEFAPTAEATMKPTWQEHPMKLDRYFWIGLAATMGLLVALPALFIGLMAMLTTIFTAKQIDQGLLVLAAIGLISLLVTGPIEIARMLRPEREQESW